MKLYALELTNEFSTQKRAWAAFRMQSSDSFSCAMCMLQTENISKDEFNGTHWDKKNDTIFEIEHKYESTTIELNMIRLKMRIMSKDLGKRRISSSIISHIGEHLNRNDTTTNNRTIYRYFIATVDWNYSS